MDRKMTINRRKRLQTLPAAGPRRSAATACSARPCAAGVPPTSRRRSRQTPGLRVNRDRSVDLWLGPTAPKGWERNWLPTDPNSRFELMARFYGPEPALFDGSWRLLDVERMT